MGLGSMGKRGTEESVGRRGDRTAKDSYEGSGMARGACPLVATEGRGGGPGVVVVWKPVCHRGKQSRKSESFPPGGAAEPSATAGAGLRLGMEKTGAPCAAPRGRRPVPMIGLLAAAA